MNKVEQLLSELDLVREQLLVAIEMLPDDALSEASRVGDGSVVDALINLTAWESEMVTALMQIQQGKRPSRLLTALADVEAYNQARFAENQERELDRVFDDLMKVRLELEEWLEMFDSRVLTDAKRYNWLNGRTLAQLISQTTIENERRFLPPIQQFAQTWLETHEEMPPTEIIPLTAVTILPAATPGAET